MSLPAIPLKEFDQEMATTRKLLERVPTEKGQWKPHEKSFALGHLAQLVSSMPGWITRSLREPHIDLAAGGGYSFEPTEALLRKFDHNVQGALEALGSVLGAALDAPWSLKHGEQVLFTSPRGEVVRMHLNPPDPSPGTAQRLPAAGERTPAADLRAHGRRGLGGRCRPASPGRYRTGSVAMRTKTSCHGSATPIKP